MRRARLRLWAAVFIAALGAGAPLTAAQTASAYSIWNLAGNGTACSTPPSCGDGPSGPAAQLGYPEGVAVGPHGDVFIADWGDNTVRKLTLSGAITTVAGGGTSCSAPPSCGDGGAATDASLSFPDGVAVDQAGNLYVADTGDNEVRKVTPSGTISRFAGNGSSCSAAPACGDGGPASAAALSSPTAVAVDRSGNVYIADAGDNEIRKVAAGKISRVAGDGTLCSKPPACGDGGLATGAQLNFPAGVAVDRSGNVYIADAGDNEIRKVTSSGTISRTAGNGSSCAKPPSCGDGGSAQVATLSTPDGVAVDGQGNQYIADDGDNEVRKVSAAGNISSIAGNGIACSQPPICGNGGPAASGQLNYPDGIAVDPSGNVYVADTYDQELRWLSASPGSTLQTPAGAALVLAFGPTVSRAAVMVRFALSADAGITLSVTAPGGQPTVVAHRLAHQGWGQLGWNRRLGGAAAPRGRYTLTITAYNSGRSASSRVSIRL